MTSAGRRLLDRLLEDVLGGHALELEARGQPGRELGEIVIEERRPRLERGEHGRAVDLGQEVVLQIHGEIHVEQLGEAVGEVLCLRSCERAEPKGRRRPSASMTLGARNALLHLGE